jgi:NADP-reducing hydrogenase subunit HndB
MKSLAELEAIKNKAKSDMSARSEAGKRIVVGMATCGIAAGARPVLNRFAELVQERKLDDVMVTQTGCIGLCQYEPIVEVYEPGKEKVTYIWMDAEKASNVVQQHLVHGNVVNEYTLGAAEKLK